MRISSFKRYSSERMDLIRIIRVWMFYTLVFAAMHDKVALGEVPTSGTVSVGSQLLVSNAKRVVDRMKSYDATASMRLEYPLEGFSLNRVGHIRYDSGKVRLDEKADLLSVGTAGEQTRIVSKNTIYAFDGSRTSQLPTDQSIFTIRDGNSIPDYALLLSGLYNYSVKLDDWLAGMRITEVTSDSVKGPDYIHRFNGIRDLPANPDQTPRYRKFVFEAGENTGFAISKCAIYDESQRLLSEWSAIDLHEVTKGIWLPRGTREIDYATDGNAGVVDRILTTNLSYDAIGAPIDAKLFSLSLPDNYALRDVDKHIVIPSSKLRSFDLSTLDKIGAKSPTLPATSQKLDLPISKPQKSTALKSVLIVMASVLAGLSLLAFVAMRRSKKQTR